MSNVIQVHTHTSERYQVKIGKDILEAAGEFFQSEYDLEKVIIVIDQNVFRLHMPRIEEKLTRAFKKVVKYIVPAGESSKSLDQFSSIVDFILKEGVERNTPLIAIGGGVIGDLAGYVASTILRGIPLIHFPTSLLAMVDSAIGGKTGVNHSTGKNLIGAFYQPKAVFADVEFLETLPKEEWVNGLSEILKYGMISNPEILNEISELIAGSEFANPEEWVSVIHKSVGIKAHIVNKDVKESGIREYLNFGHTFAHVLEQKGEYSSLSHGEAVFAGMFGAFHASNKTGSSLDISNLMHFKSLYDIKLNYTDENISEFIDLMLRDKKVKNRTIRLVLLEELGLPVVRSFEETSIVEESWKFLFSQFN